MRSIICSFVFLFLSFFSVAQNIDVQHYKFRLQLSDETDRIEGRAVIAVKFLGSKRDFTIDLVGVKDNGKGMKVDSVKGRWVSGFQQANDQIKIQLKNGQAVNSTDTIEILYSGIPADGLIISKNKYGDRTFFSDNWPNRARHWIPCNDRPDDKASVEFLVTAPSYYQVISNGIQIEETDIDKKRKLSYWKEPVPIPTKVMVIGAAQFAVGRVDSSYKIPVTAWVYPRDKQKGFYDYSLSTSILQFFESYIGPYAFQKLANVQSKTIFGGMENANAIFYAENTVTGDRKSEALLAHEIAHQWFGNMATEKSFAHLWLSEGFATYLTNIYWRNKYGETEFHKRLIEEREQAVSFSRVSKNAVVDSTSDLMDLLNANSYQKGGWVLRMLEAELGEATFKKLIQTYYDQYKGSNASTRDFQKVAEQVGGKSMQVFFDQWLYQPNTPKINVQWKMQGKDLAVTVQQTGKALFQFPLTVGYLVDGGKMTEKMISITKAIETFTIPVSSKPAKLMLDPQVRLLFDGNVSESR